MSKPKTQSSETRPKVIVYQRKARGNSILYIPKAIPRPLTLIERLRIARQKVWAEQAKQEKLNKNN